MSDQPAPESKDFIRQIIADDLESGKHTGIVTRFPPEPNGYLHIGHAKAICLSFGVAEETGGRCHLRFDDTNPVKEEQEFVDAITEDVRWLGFDWGDHLYFASDYFEQMYAWAEQLIEQGQAYVCTLSPEEFKDVRGGPTQPGTGSPWRDRPPEESLTLFREMRDGVHPDGSLVLRAKIDMASPNLHLRDPAMYRIKHADHHRTGDTWCVYPMYDWAHGLEDSIEQVTHSLCTLEFEVHRPLYDWFLEALSIYHPRQVEFARLNLTYTVMSKRLLQQLVEEGRVNGWDDPRMPTLHGLRRRGYPPEAIRAFCTKVGVTKFESLTDVSLLEHCVRDQLNRTSPRRMAVLDPLKVVITNYPEEDEETFALVNNPEDPEAGTRAVSFSRELWIERGDFMEDPPKKFFRLAPGREVRLRGACYITCEEVIKNAEQEVVELRCTFDPSSRGGSTPDGRRIKSTLHWVSARHGQAAEVRLYDRLFNAEDPLDQGPEQVTDYLSPDSLKAITAYIEPILADVTPETRVQFERIGYFCADRHDHRPEKPVFNRTVTLRDSWGKKGK